MSLLLAALLATSAVSSKGAIATAHPAASEAGAEQLRRGGNAVDAAVAAAFALTVVEPFSSGIGGGGFALVWLAEKKELHAIDFREVAPAAATKDMYVRDGKVDPDLSLTGGLAVAVPGAVRGYAELVRRFGKRKLSKVLAPAVRLAEQGHRVGLGWVRASTAVPSNPKVTPRLQALSKDPGARKALLLQDEDGEPRAPEPGETIVQKDLARTLRLIGQTGGEAFYRGPLARKLVAGVKAAGGILTLEDLARYKVRERQAIEGHYRGMRIATFPPPSAGGALLIGLLQTLEGYQPRAGGYRPEKWLHAMIETEKRLFAKRETSFGDPDFYPRVTEAVAEMISPKFAEALRAQIGEKATPAEQIAAHRESDHTTHISVVDAEGNAVAITTTVNYVFGSCVVPPGTGVVMNDQMDDFDSAPGVANVYGLVGTEANAIAPGKVPLSSMTPTIVFDEQGAVRLVVGAPGGSTIPTTVAQVISHFFDDGMRLDQALAAPRIHEQLKPEEVRVEANGLDAATAAALEARGHKLRFLNVNDGIGNAQAVSVDPKTGWRTAASDPRHGGAGAIP